VQPDDRTRSRARLAAIAIVFALALAEVAIRIGPGTSGLDFIVNRTLYPASILIALVAFMVFLRTRQDSLWRAAFTLGALFFSLYAAEMYRVWVSTDSVLPLLPDAFSGAGSPVPWLVARSFIYVAVLILFGVFWFVDGTPSITRPRMGHLSSEIEFGQWKISWLVLLPIATVVAVVCGSAMSVYLRDRPQMFLEFIPDSLWSKALGALNNAFAEEVVFRAILLQSFRRAVGARWGNLLQTVVFTVGHVYWGPLGIVVCGLSAYFLWGKSALGTRGILWAVITHAAAVLGLVMFVGR
jgi:membrane protease YdiL (CAAX protease family)